MDAGDGQDGVHENVLLECEPGKVFPENVQRSVSQAEALDEALDGVSGVVVYKLEVAELCGAGAQVG